jgi:hypothetical protein
MHSKLQVETGNVGFILATLNSLCEYSRSNPKSSIMRTVTICVTRPLSLAVESSIVRCPILLVGCRFVDAVSRCYHLIPFLILAFLVALRCIKKNAMIKNIRNNAATNAARFKHRFNDEIGSLTIAKRIAKKTVADSMRGFQETIIC